MRSLQSCKSALTVTLRGKAVFTGVIQRRLVGCGRFSRLAPNATASILVTIGTDCMPTNWDNPEEMDTLLETRNRARLNREETENLKR